MPAKKLKTRVKRKKLNIGEKTAIATRPEGSTVVDSAELSPAEDAARNFKEASIEAAEGSVSSLDQRCATFPKQKRKPCDKSQLSPRDPSKNSQSMKSPPDLMERPVPPLSLKLKL